MKPTRPSGTCVVFVLFSIMHVCQKGLSSYLWDVIPSLCSLNGSRKIPNYSPTIDSVFPPQVWVLI